MEVTNLLVLFLFSISLFLWAKSIVNRDVDEEKKKKEPTLRMVNFWGKLYLYKIFY